MRASTAAAPARRREILDVTFRHLVDRGFEGLRIREVAEAVGINQATLLYHYPDKEELIVAVIGDIIERIRAHNLRDIEIRRGSFSAFETNLHALGDLIVSSPEIMVAMNEIAVRAARHDKIAAALSSYRQAWLDYIKTLLRAGAPEAKPAAIDEAAYLTLTFLLGLRIDASATGALTTLLKRGKGRTDVARRIRSQIDAFCTLVRTGLGN